MAPGWGLAKGFVPIGQIFDESGEHHELAGARLVETGLHLERHVLGDLAQDVQGSSAGVTKFVEQHKGLLAMVVLLELLPHHDDSRHRRACHRHAYQHLGHLLLHGFEIVKL